LLVMAQYRSIWVRSRIPIIGQYQTNSPCVRNNVIIVDHFERVRQRRDLSLAVDDRWPNRLSLLIVALDESRAAGFAGFSESSRGRIEFSPEHALPGFQLCNVALGSLCRTFVENHITYTSRSLRSLRKCGRALRLAMEIPVVSFRA